jgi:hypothetical protein
LAANQLAARNRHADALRELARYLRLVPGDIQVLLTKLQIEAHLQRYDDALDSCLLVLALDPSCKHIRPSLEVLLGNPALAHRHDEVLRRLDPGAPDHPDARVLREIAAELMPTFIGCVDEMIAAGSIAAAAARLQRCQSIAPTSVPVRLGLVRLRIAQRQVAEAIDLCLGILDEDPANDPALAALGDILQRAHRPHRLDDVGTALSRHLKAKPENPQGIACLMHWADAVARVDGARAASGAVEHALAAVPESRRIRDRIVRLLEIPQGAAGASAHAATTPPTLAGAQTLLLAPSDAEQDAYDRLVALNVVDTIGGIARRFYRDVGYDIRSAPLVALLAELREELAVPSVADAASSTWPLLRFEAAWNLYLNDERERSVELLRTLIDDPALLRFAHGDRFVKEALVRSGEIVGRRDERAGDDARAMSVYRRTMQLEENGVVARRMALLHWRRGDLRGAMEAADAAVMSKQNLFPRLPEGPYVSWLRRALAERGCRMA